MKLNFLTIFIIATILILSGGVFFFSKNQSVDGGSLPAPTSYEYYWSKTCPHCAKVQEFMDTWEGRDKIQMEKYEINESKENQQRFLQRGKDCKIPRSQMGVPLLLTPKGVCLSGDEPIIQHFKDLGI